MIQVEIPRGRRLFLIICEIFLVFIGLEVGIRIAEKGYYFYFERLALINVPYHKDSYRIVCLGESTVHGIGVSSSEKTFPNQLRKYLKEYSHDPIRKIEVYNMGIAAVNVEKIYKNLDYILNKYDPHLVILLVGHNMIDLPLLFSDDPSKSLDNFFVHLNQLKVVRLFRLLGAFSENIFSGEAEPLIIKERFYFKHAPSMTAQYNYNNSLIREQHEDRSRLLQKISQMWLEKVVKKLKNRMENRVVICNYFNSWANEDIRSLAVKYNIPFCDNEKMMESYQHKGRAAEFLSDDGWHPNDQGYDLIAHNIFQIILNHNFIEK